MIRRGKVVLGDRLCGFERALVFASRHEHRKTQRFNLEQLRVLRHDELRIGGLHAHFHRRGGKSGEQRNVDRAQADESNKSHHELFALGQQNTHAVAFADALGFEMAGKLAAALLQLTVGELCNVEVVVDEGEGDSILRVAIAQHCGGIDITGQHFFQPRIDRCLINCHGDSHLCV